MSYIQWQIDVFKTAPNRAARDMVSVTADLDDFHNWLSEVYLCVNTAMLKAGIGGNPDLALPPEDSLAKLYVDIMTYDELRQTKDWLVRLAAQE